MGKQRVLFGLRADGEEFPIEASISQIDDSDGKLYTVMLRDVTERVNADDGAQAVARGIARTVGEPAERARRGKDAASPASCMTISASN